MNILSELDQLNNLTENEKILVQYIKDNTLDFIKLSPTEISKACFVSTSSIYRLCHKLGINGLSQLKVLVSMAISEYQKEKGKLDYNYPIKQNETQYQIVNNLEELYYQTILSTKNLLDLEQLRLICLALKKAKHIDVYTSAGNLYFANNFMFQMQEINVDINVPQEEYLQRLVASNSDKDHIAIVISFQGRGHNTRDIVKILKKTKTPIVLIGAINDNPLAVYSDYKLFFSSYEDHFNKISSFSTRLSLLYLLDSIYSCYFKLDYDKNIETKIKGYKRMRGN